MVKKVKHNQISKKYQPPKKTIKNKNNKLNGLVKLSDSI